MTEPSVSRQWSVEIVPIRSIKPHPQNYREHDIGAITLSIGHFGLYLPVVVQRSTGFIVAGSGRWEALLARGETEIPVRFEDFTDKEALAVLVADNWIAQRGRNLDPELLELMQVEALEREVADMDRPLKLDSRKMTSKKTIKATCPECGHKFTIEKGKP